MGRRKKTVKEQYETPFATRLRFLLSDRGLTQAAVARALKKNATQMCCYCNGITEPTFAVLVAMADYFNVTTDYLLGRTERMR